MHFARNSLNVAPGSCQKKKKKKKKVLYKVTDTNLKLTYVFICSAGASDIVARFRDFASPPALCFIADFAGVPPEGLSGTAGAAAACGSISTAADGSVLVMVIGGGSA
jgi:hypothetical protein